MFRVPGTSDRAMLPNLEQFSKFMYLIRSGGLIQALPTFQGIYFTLIIIALASVDFPVPVSPENDTKLEKCSLLHLFLAVPVLQSCLNRLETEIVAPPRSSLTINHCALLSS